MFRAPDPPYRSALDVLLTVPPRQLALLERRSMGVSMKPGDALTVMPCGP